MMALRRASSSIRSYRLTSTGPCGPKLQGADYRMGNVVGEVQHFFHDRASVLPGAYNSLGFSSSRVSCLGYRSLSSRTDAESTEKEAGLGEGFSEVLETIDTDETLNEEVTMNLRSGLEFALEEDSAGVADAETNDLCLSRVEEESGKASMERSFSTLLDLIMDAPRHSFNNIVDKWLSEGNSLGRNEISVILLHLRKKRCYASALQFCEWLAENNHVDFMEGDYAIHLDLIAKVHNVHRAEKYIERIPVSYRSEFIYDTLLANCVSVYNLKKAEEVFNKIRDNGFPLSAFACNQLLLLYKRINQNKMADVLATMEKAGIKSTVFTYEVLIESKGRVNDIKGMEQIVETMKAEGINPGINIQAIVARYYISGGCSEKAETILKEMEGDDVRKNRSAFRVLLPLYATIGKVEDVERLWKICEADVRLDECLAAISAWGKLRNIENAEAVFEHIIKTWKQGKKLSSKCYTALLEIYADNKLLRKAEDLLKRMTTDGYRVGPLTWDALSKLYLNMGKVEKAGALLQKEAEKNRKRPMFTSYCSVLAGYAKKGDIHNAEKVFDKMRMSGYIGRMSMYQTLLEAYVNAKSPAYGFRERLKADNMFVHSKMARLLQANDSFKNTWISKVLN